MTTTDIDRIRHGLTAVGVDVHSDDVKAGNDLVIGREGRGRGAPVALVHLREDLLTDYLADVRGDHSRSPDPHDDALGTVTMLLLEILTKDHGDGSNLVRRVELRRGRNGSVALTADLARAADLPDELPPGEYQWTADGPG